MPEPRWEHRLSWFYYAIGSLYYIYHWLLILGGVGVLAGAATAILSQAHRERALTAVFCAVLSLGFVALGLVLAGRARTIRLHSDNPALTLLRVESEYAGEGNGAYTYKRTVRAVARATGASRYVHKFWWSGAGTVSADQQTTGYSISLAEEELGTRTICTVQFPRMMPKSKTEEFWYRLRLNDAHNRARPFLGYTVDSPIKELVLRVGFPAGSAARVYKRQRFVNASSEIPVFEQEMIRPDGENWIEWTIPQPRFGYFYQLTWEREPSPQRNSIEVVAPVTVLHSDVGEPTAPAAVPAARRER